MSVNELIEEFEKEHSLIHLVLKDLEQFKDTESKNLPKELLELFNEWEFPFIKHTGKYQTIKRENEELRSQMKEIWEILKMQTIGESQT